MSRLMTLPILILVLLGGCGNRLSPLEVSERFWSAVQQGDAPAVQRYSITDNGQLRPALEDLLPVGAVEFGRVIIEEDRAVVDTAVTIDGDNGFTIPLKTHLRRQEQAWKVDYEATVQILHRDGRVASLLDTIRRVNEALSRQLQESLAELQGLVPLLERELAILEQALRDSIPELRRQLEEALREFEESLRRPPDAEPSEHGTIEL